MVILMDLPKQAVPMVFQIDTDVKLHSGGGDIVLRGETYSTSTNRHGILQTGNLNH